LKFKVLLLLIAASAVLHGHSLWAQQPPPSAPAAASSIGYDAVGVVKRVDVTAGTVTIAHEAIAGLNWPAMTMSFSVKDKALFDKLAVDRRVQFTVAKQGAAYVVTSVRPSPQ
jgi:Cu(I)/Ag(I) efflux system periplasmic protein CusF